MILTAFQIHSDWLLSPVLEAIKSIVQDFTMSLALFCSYSLIISRLLSLPVLMTTSFSLEPDPLVHTSMSPSPFWPCSPSSPSVTWGDDDSCHAGMEGGTTGLLGEAAGNWCLEWENINSVFCVVLIFRAVELESWSEKEFWWSHS